MTVIVNTLLLLIVVQLSSGDDDYIINTNKFPDDFMFGIATSSFQIEGALTEDGRGIGIWDVFIHENSSRIANGANADIACDSYHKYETDIENLKYLGVNHYRFSISWPRILPQGTPDQINQKGIEYYKKLIRGLKANNIEPLITIYHWDLPQVFQELGGLHNATFSKWYADFARVCFENFGDDVKYWLTFNEPLIACMGYEQPTIAPGLNMPGVGEYLCTHNLIKAHAAAYHVYDEEFRLKQKGKLTIAQAVNAVLPASNSTEDIAAANQMRQFLAGWVSNPIYYGDYPDIMKERIAKRSKAEGFEKSRLPEFTEEEKDFIKNTSDFFAINTYNTTYVQACPEPEIGIPDLDKDAGVRQITEISADGMMVLLLWISEHYGNPDIFISENGHGSNLETLDDTSRIEFVQAPVI